MSGGEYPAPAKLNLFLHVLGRRADGYHELQTVFVFLDRADLLRIEVRRDGAVARRTVIDGVPESEDLCVRAANLLRQHAGSVLGADLWLSKRIPMGGGLGGGSSDAATCLLALDRLWGLDLPRAELAALGARLGADVPVFVEGRAAFAGSIGEVLHPVDVPPAWYVVLTPDALVPTRDVFAYPDIPRDTAPVVPADWYPGFGRNDLQEAVARRFPAVAECLAWLAGHGDARMTGSGACVFAPFASEEEAGRVLATLPPHLRGFVARGQARHPLAVADG
jgi:4-diphosphocytidyl-2-C-methyl-D-erythritol kinase